MTEFHRVFGAGVQSGGVYLLGGEPGIGKSTIVLQIIADLQQSSPDIITGYCSAEEHPQHVADRRGRIIPDTELKTSIYRATDVADIVTTMQQIDHDLMIIDSIQTIHSSQSDAPAGSPNQVRIVSEQLVAAAKMTNTTLIIVGHVTKGGEIAGPKYLEHIVDVVLYLEGDSDGQLRFLRVKKNRFGPTHDTGIFDMTLFGLQPVYDMQTRMLERFHAGVPGSALTIGLDNGRPVLTSIEVLLNKTSGKYPQRRCIGVDKGRVDMIVAILEKYCQLKL
jgi:DNA repair protein RadA/Sms